MRYTIDIRLEKEKRTYLIDADDETQAQERLLLRLAPNMRDKCIIDSIKIDPSSISSIEPYGIFGEE
jgi:hypothetical protein